MHKTEKYDSVYVKIAITTWIMTMLGYIADLFIIDISNQIHFHSNMISIISLIVLAILFKTNSSKLNVIYAIITFMVIINSMISLFFQENNMSLIMLRDILFIFMVISFSAYICGLKIFLIAKSILFLFILTITFISKDAFLIKNIVFLLSILIVFTVTTYYLVLSRNNIIENKSELLTSIAAHQLKIEEQNEELNQINQNLQKINEALIEKQNDLEFNKQELQKSNDTKNTLLTILGHDLKNPVMGIMTLSRLLADKLDVLSEEKKTFFIKGIADASEQLFYQLDNLLIWTKKQKYELEYNPVPLDISSIIMKCIQLYKKQIELKNITLTNSITEPCLVKADENMTFVIFRNIINNAVKFTKENEKIDISISCENQFIKACIFNSGSVILDSEINKNKTISQSTTGTGGEKGTGIGLNLISEFALLQEGKFELFNEQNGVMAIVYLKAL